MATVSHFFQPMQEIAVPIATLLQLGLLSLYTTLRKLQLHKMISLTFMRVCSWSPLSISSNNTRKRETEFAFWICLSCLSLRVFLVSRNCNQKHLQTIVFLGPFRSKTNRKLVYWYLKKAPWIAFSKSKTVPPYKISNTKSLMAELMENCLLCVCPLKVSTGFDQVLDYLSQTPQWTLALETCKSDGTHQILNV